MTDFSDLTQAYRSASSALKNARGQDPDVDPQVKKNHCRTAVNGDSDILRFQSLPRVSYSSIGQKPISASKRRCALPSSSFASTSSVPGNLTRLGDSEVHIGPGQYPSHTPKSSAKRVRNHHRTRAGSLLLPIDDVSHISTIDVVHSPIDGQYRGLFSCVEFKDNSEPSLSATKVHYSRADGGKSGSFVNQSAGAGSMPSQFVESTHITATNTDMDDIMRDLVRRVKELDDPSELDSLFATDEHRSGADQEKIGSFVNQSAGAGSLPSPFNESTHINAAITAGNNGIHDLVHLLKELQLLSKPGLEIVANNEAGKSCINHFPYLDLLLSQLAEASTHGNETPEEWSSNSGST
ncbi:hypothetical protein RSOL_325080, partial [Rhizoctonia solani AG-3 Rhs1AP]